MDYLSLVTAFSIGLLGGAHCIGMCGGIIGALTMSLKADQYWRRLILIVSYNIGRILSYVLIAWLFYSVIDSLQNYLSISFMRIVAGLLLIAMGFYLANWWRGLVYLEKVGGFLWQFIQPLAKSFMPVKSVGVKGDARHYGYVVALRAVKTTDFMTAHWADLPHDFLSRVSRRIVNEVAEISRVVYDICGKPPATIEWE